MSFTRAAAAAIVLGVSLSSIAGAQTVPTMPNMPGMQHDTPATPGWRVTEDASLFFGFNDQERKFRDFHAWESQNWLIV